MAEPPPLRQEPPFPDQQLTEPPGLRARRGREHAMRDAIGIEQGEGDVLVTRHHERLMASRVQGGDHVAEDVGQRGVADVDEHSHGCATLT